MGGLRRWWRERVSFESKAALVLLGLVALGVIGWIGASSLGSASAGGTTSDETTDGRVVVQTVRQVVRRVVTVRSAGKVVRVRVPVVKRVVVPGKTTTVLRPGKTLTVSAPAATVVSTRTVVQAVTAPAPATKPKTVTVTQTVKQTQTVQQTKTVTQVRWRVITVIQKQPPVTVTVTTPAP